MKTRKAPSTEDQRISPPENIPYQALPIVATQIVLISPKKSLGSFIRGTMNFSGRYAKRLMDIGYRNACESIQNRNQ
jgi:hypothetical protein